MQHFQREEFKSPTNSGPFNPPELGIESQIREAREVCMKIPLNFLPVPSSWKGSYSLSGGHSGTTMSGCYAKRDPKWRQHSENPTIFLPIIWPDHATTVKEIKSLILSSTYPLCNFQCNR